MARRNVLKEAAAWLRSWIDYAVGSMEPSESVARLLRLLSWSTVIGVLAGLVAAGLDTALEIGVEHLIGRVATPSGSAVLQLAWPVLLLPALGGLVSGLVVLLLARKSTGHGTDQLVRAFHFRDGQLELRGPLTKGVAAVGVISCGGSAGPEGPIAAIGAAIGSSVARWLRLSASERRVLLLAGCAGGVGAIFGCPLGGALFAASILYREPEFESEALVPAFIASVVSYSTFMAFDRYGTFLLKDADKLVFSGPFELPIYLLLGIACGLFAMLLSVSMSTVSRFAGAATGLPVWLKPAVGGLLTGIIALLLPQIMDNRYQFVQKALDGSLFAADGRDWWAWALLFGSIAVAKCVGTAFTVGSGASGGLLGPAVLIGGLAGAFVGAAVTALWPAAVPETLRQALIPVGMAGVLSASMRIPIASMVMVIEMTGSYGLVVPLMLVVATAYLVGQSRGLIEEQVRSSAESPAHGADSIIHLLESYVVQDVMRKDWPFLATPSTRLRELLERLQSGTRPHFAVLRGERLVGVISVTDLLQLADEPYLTEIIVADEIMTKKLITIDPERTLYQALRIFRERNVDVLPVVERERRGQGKFCGMLTRKDVHVLVRRHMDRMREHVLREHVVLGAIDQDNTLSQLLAGMPSPDLGTIQRMPVPSDLRNRSLRDVDFRNVYRAEVLAIQTADGHFLCPPDPRRPLAAEDQLIILGNPGESADVSAASKEEPSKGGIVS